MTGPRPWEPCALGAECLSSLFSSDFLERWDLVLGASRRCCTSGSARGAGEECTALSGLWCRALWESHGGRQGETTLLQPLTAGPEVLHTSTHAFSVCVLCRAGDHTRNTASALTYRWGKYTSHNSFCSYYLVGIVVSATQVWQTGRSPHWWGLSAVPSRSFVPEELQVQTGNWIRRMHSGQEGCPRWPFAQVSPLLTTLQ